jgi:SAM-dependent methyltransferase
MESERIDALIRSWKREEETAHIHGWDFSHIHDRSREEEPPWDYRQIISEYRRADGRLLDYDTGGGEFLLSLGHPYEHTAATEGYPPNVALCEERLLPLGIDFRPCADPAHIPFPDETFDLLINRHGSFDAGECFRLLKPGGVFVTQQVGADNDRELVEMVLPGTPLPFPDMRLSIQRERFREAGFEILRAEEAFLPITFSDIGAFVWFARIIEWEFPDFSVERCLPRLLAMQRRLEAEGEIGGRSHRFLIVARKN